MIRRFNRYELKYILPLSKCAALETDLASYLPLDAHGGQSGYGLMSLYYDSPGKDFFWAKIEGIKFRRKVRMRAYIKDHSAPLGDVMVEIKQRINRTVQKKRLVLPLGTAESLCNDRVLPEGLDTLDQQVAHEVLYLTHSMHLEPSAVTAYNRKAYEGVNENAGLRVTFDTKISGRVHALCMDPTVPNQLVLPIDWCVMEVKANDRVPDWLTSLLALHDCSLRRISKYCAVISYFGDRNLMPLAIQPTPDLPQPPPLTVPAESQ